MGAEGFVEFLVKEIVNPGVESLMATRYFSELRQGKLSVRRLQGFALQHYLTNVALCKGFALCMVKYAHQPELYNHFWHQLEEEQFHPDLVKRFGLALGLQEEDFANVLPVFGSLAHTSAALRGMLVGAPAENRVWALVNESMVRRYSEEFYAHLTGKHGLSDHDLEFFSVHAIADQDHTQRAARVVAGYTRSVEDQKRVENIARHAVRFKVLKFDSIYEAYA